MAVPTRNPGVYKKLPGSSALDQAVWRDMLKAATVSNGALPGRFFFTIWCGECFCKRSQREECPSQGQ
jgi:hypothetical protein